MASDTASTPESLLDVALTAEKALEQLATGLGQVGAPPDTVKAVTKMADVTRQIVSALGKGQEETGDAEPPAPEPKQTFDSATNALHQEAQAAAQRPA